MTAYVVGCSVEAGLDGDSQHMGGSSRCCVGHLSRTASRIRSWKRMPPSRSFWRWVKDDKNPAEVGVEQGSPYLTEPYCART